MLRGTALRRGLDRRISVKPKSSSGPTHRVNPFVRFSEHVQAHHPDVKQAADTVKRLRLISALWKELPPAEQRNYQNPAWSPPQVMTAAALAVATPDTTTTTAVAQRHHHRDRRVLAASVLGPELDDAVEPSAASSADDVRAASRHGTTDGGDVVDTTAEPKTPKSVTSASRDNGRLAHIFKAIPKSQRHGAPATLKQ